MKKWRNARSFVLLTLLGVALAFSGCKKKNNGGDDDDDDTTSKSATISVDLSDSGDNNITAGECVSFTITGTNTTFLTNFAVQLDYSDGALSQVIPDALGTLPLITVDSDTVAHVGVPSDAASGPCWCFGPGAFTGCEVVPTGNIDVLIQDSAQAPFKVDNAFVLADVAQTTLTLDTPVAGTIGREAGTDYYRIDGLNPLLHVVTTIPTGTADWLPITYGYPGLNLGPYDGLISLGARGTVRDYSFLGAAWDFNPAVVDNLLGGGTGYDYSMTIHELTPTDLTGGNIADTWDDGGGVNDNADLMDLAPGGTAAYLATLAAANNDYNPNPNSVPDDEMTWGTGCVSQDDVLPDPMGGPFFPILGRGPDAVYAYDATGAAADHDVLISVQSEGDGANTGTGDFLLYIVEDPATNLPNAADGTCVAGADLFGDIATDTAVFTAVAGTKYYVFVDTFAQVAGIGDYTLTVVVDP